MAENDFWQRGRMTVLYPVVKIFVEIALSRNIFEINSFCINAEFKIVPKNGGKMILGKKWKRTMSIPWQPKISSKSLYLAPFPR